MRSSSAVRVLRPAKLTIKGKIQKIKDEFLVKMINNLNKRFPKETQDIITTCTKTLIHAFVSSHLDYCNALLFGLPKYQLDRLQKVQNAAAKVIVQIAKFDHITPALIDLHWLPVTFRVQFKLFLFVYKSLHNQSPSYIKDLLSLTPAPYYALRSSAQSVRLHNLFCSFQKSPA